MSENKNVNEYHDKTSQHVRVKKRETFPENEIQTLGDDEKTKSFQSKRESSALAKEARAKARAESCDVRSKSRTSDERSKSRTSDVRSKSSTSDVKSKSRIRSADKQSSDIGSKSSTSDVRSKPRIRSGEKQSSDVASKSRTRSGEKLLRASKEDASGVWVTPSNTVREKSADVHKHRNAAREQTIKQQTGAAVTNGEHDTLGKPTAPAENYGKTRAKSREGMATSADSIKIRKVIWIGEESKKTVVKSLRSHRQTRPSSSEKSSQIVPQDVNDSIHRPEGLYLILEFLYNY